MALLNEKGNYIKLLPTGDFDIYRNIEDRLKVKNNIPAEDIINRYTQMIKEYQADSERLYYDPEFSQELSSLTEEYQKYSNDVRLRKGPSKEGYPIMKKTYDFIEDTVPNVIESGNLEFTTDTAEEAYIKAVEEEYWGETTPI